MPTDDRADASATSAPTLDDYASFLPPRWRERVDRHPISNWWQWGGHNIHFLRRPSPDAPVRVLVIHGAGAHSAALWPIASLLPREVADLSAVDLPLYGRTITSDRADVRYGDWIAMLGDFIAADADPRPLILLGASIGGMLGYEVAATTDRVSTVVATCLLDPRDRRARAVMTRFGPLGMISGPLAKLLPERLAARCLPISEIAALSKMSRNPGLRRLCGQDPRGGGSPVPLGFLRSYLTYRHTQPEDMQVPVTLAHPALDGWTPVEISVRWLSRISAPAGVVMLRRCGHFPVEDPGLEDLIDTLTAVIHWSLTRRID